KAVACLSAACTDRIKRHENKGYRIVSARIRFMVFWKPDDDRPGEIMIILPELVMAQQQNS
ncbi:MAG: hypothetical protein J5700_04780, partial [Treponema sp.]|nr:hypothetical protein [Treponema sp.]